MLATAGFVQSENDFEVKQNADNTLAITKYNGAATDVVIPSALHGLKVTIIGDDAFCDKNLTNVVIPNTVTHIGGYAFANNNIKELVLPARLKEIDKGAFKNNQIRALIIPNGVTVIKSLVFSTNEHGARKYYNEGAFDGNPLEFISIPVSLAKLDKNRSNSWSWSDDGHYFLTAGIDYNTFGDDEETGDKYTPDCIILPAVMDEWHIKGFFEEGLADFYESQNKAAGGYIKRGSLWTKASAAETNKVESPTKSHFQKLPPNGFLRN